MSRNTGLPSLSRASSTSLSFNAASASYRIGPRSFRPLTTTTARHLGGALDNCLIYLEPVSRLAFLASMNNRLRDSSSASDSLSCSAAPTSYRVGPYRLCLLTTNTARHLGGALDSCSIRPGIDLSPPFINRRRLTAPGRPLHFSSTAWRLLLRESRLAFLASMNNRLRDSSSASDSLSCSAAPTSYRVGPYRLCLLTTNTARHLGGALDSCSIRPGIDLSPPFINRRRLTAPGRPLHFSSTARRLLLCEPPPVAFFTSTHLLSESRPAPLLPHNSKEHTKHTLVNTRTLHNTGSPSLRQRMLSYIQRAPHHHDRHIPKCECESPHVHTRQQTPSLLAASSRPERSRCYNSGILDGPKDDSSCEEHTREHEK